MELNRVDEILSIHNQNKSSLIPILQEIQSDYNYLPEDALIHISRKLSISLIDIYSVATFYKSFSLTPRGRNLITVCLGTACHVRGAPRILDEFERRLKISAGDTTPDNLFTLQTVNCLGACALGPIVVVNEEYYSQTTISKVGSIIEKYII